MRLEVGKTYVSRAGKQVKIVEEKESGSPFSPKYPFKGDNALWYTSQGIFDLNNPSGGTDLIKEARPLTRQEALTEADRLEAQAKALRETFKQPELAPGQVWEDCSGIYIITDELHGMNLKTGIITLYFFNLAFANYLGTFDEVFILKGEK